MIATHHPVTGEPLLYVDVKSLPPSVRMECCSNCALNEDSEVNIQWKNDLDERPKLVSACVSHDCYATGNHPGVYLVNNEQGCVQLAEWKLT